MNIINEEIQAIKHTMSHLRMIIPLEEDIDKRHKMEQDLIELKEILVDKLGKCEDYKG